MMRSIVQLSGSGSIIAQRGSTSGSQKHAGIDGSYGLVIAVPHSSKSSIISHAATSAAGDSERRQARVWCRSRIANGRAPARRWVARESWNRGNRGERAPSSTREL